MRRYAVVSILNGAGQPHTGIISTHRTAEEAREHIAKENRKLRALPGNEANWNPWAVLDRETGTVEDHQR